MKMIFKNEFYLFIVQFSIAVFIYFIDNCLNLLSVHFLASLQIMKYYRELNFKKNCGSFSRALLNKRKTKNHRLTVVMTLNNSSFVMKPSPLMSIFLKALISSSLVVNGICSHMSTKSSNVRLSSG